MVNNSECLVDPCYVYDLVSSEYPEFFEFKVKTITTGDVYHLSPIVTVNIATIFTYTAKEITEDEAAAMKAVEEGAYFPAENVDNLLDLGIIYEERSAPSEQDPNTKKNEHDVKANYGGKLVFASVMSAIAGSMGIFFFRQSGSSLQRSNMDREIISRMRTSGNGTAEYGAVGHQSMN